MDDKLDRILSESARLFSQHGFKKVTMSEIAEAASMSRPTLYAALPNKEAVLDAIAVRTADRGDAELAARLPRAKTLEARLSVLVDVWIIEPFAGVVDSPGGLDLLGNIAVYAPKGCGEIYARFEAHLVALLAPEMPDVKGRRGMTAKDLAHIVTLATRGLKQTTTTVPELRRMTDGLIAMAVATARAER